MEEVHTLREVIRYASACYRGMTAFRYKTGRKETETKSYEDLAHDTAAVSRAIEALGLSGKHIALLGTTSYAWIVCYFGIANSGSVAVPLDAQLSKETLTELLNRADVSALFYDAAYEDTAEAAKKACPGISVYTVFHKAEADGAALGRMGAAADTKETSGTAESKTAAAKAASLETAENTERTGVQPGKNDGENGAPSSYRCEELPDLLRRCAGAYNKSIAPDKLCTILFTSGTTGKSKGVMLTHRNLTDNAVCLDMKIPAGTVSMTLLPINHVYCLTMDIIKGLFIGLEICINDSIMHVQKNLKLFRPQIMLVVPMVLESIYAKMEDAGRLLPKKLVAHEVFGGRLKTICSGGAYLDPVYVDRFQEYGITVLQGYGMTENAPVVSTNLEWANRKGSVGKLLPNCEAKIEDEEIWVRGTSVMQGYYKMPEETKETLTPDGWLKTGDLGYLDADGYLYITGRRKNLIILANGENVSPEELENLLYKNRLVKEAVVREKDRIIEAEIFPDEELAKKKHIKDLQKALEDAVLECNQALPSYKRISRVLLRTEEFPKTTTRKIKR